MEEQYYTIKEVAKHFKVSRQTIYDWMEAGRLGHVTIGARRRITGTQIAAFIASGAGGSAPAPAERKDAPAEE